MVLDVNLTSVIILWYIQISNLCCTLETKIMLCVIYTLIIKKKKRITLTGEDKSVLSHANKTFALPWKWSSSAGSLLCISHIWPPPPTNLPDLSGSVWIEVAGPVWVHCQRPLRLLQGLPHQFDKHAQAYLNSTMDNRFPAIQIKQGSRKRNGGQGRRMKGHDLVLLPALGPLLICILVVNSAIKIAVHPLACLSSLHILDHKLFRGPAPSWLRCSVYQKCLGNFFDN